MRSSSVSFPKWSPIFFFILLIGYFLLYPPQEARGWGSVGFADKTKKALSTHEDINISAYDKIKKDPAFDEGLFLPLKKIQAHEGIDINQQGKGPDGIGNSDYDEHYYNPKVNIPGIATGAQGKAPSSVAREFTKLITALLGGKTAKPGKAAAYSSHFLADVWVPYHTLGTNKETAEKIFAKFESSQPNPNPPDKKMKLLLNASVYADLKVMTSNWFSAHSDDFRTEMMRFRAANKKDPAVNWFDPWYFDGPKPQNTSHIQWEAVGFPPRVAPKSKSISDINYPMGLTLVSEGDQPKPVVYDTNWKNSPTPSFSDPSDDYRNLAVTFTKTIAKNTNLKAVYYATHGPEALAGAITSVATLWRASFSGLRPKIEIKSTEDGQLKVTGSVANKAQAEAGEVKVRIVVEGGSILEPADPSDQVIELGDIPAKTGKAEIGSGWKIEKTGKKCTVTVEVIGRYPDSCPDLQYAKVVQPLRAEWPRVYEGKGRLEMSITCMGAKNSSSTWVDNFPFRVNLHAPDEGGSAKADGGAQFAQSHTLNACKGHSIRKDRQTVTYPHGSHDGQSKFRLSIDGDEYFGGTFDDTHVRGAHEWRAGFPPNDPQVKIEIKINWELPLIPGGAVPQPPTGAGSSQPTGKINKLRAIFKKSKTE